MPDILEKMKAYMKIPLILISDSAKALPAAAQNSAESPMFRRILYGKATMMSRCPS